MKKRLICIECPSGCTINMDIKNGKVVGIKGNSCPKGEHYAVVEIENPVRVVTSSVYAEGLEVKMVPVKTDAPVPKEEMHKVMEAIKKARIKNPLEVGGIIMENVNGMGVNVVATRKVDKV